MIKSETYHHHAQLHESGASNSLFLTTTLLKNFTPKVDGFTFVHFYLKVITSDEKVVYKQEKSSLEGIIF